MAEESDQGEKTEEPSQYRIDEYRKKGQVASSKELTSFIILAGCLLTLSLSVVYIYEELGEYVRWIYGLDLEKAFAEKGLKKIASKGAMSALRCVAPVLLVSLCLGVIGNVMQIGFLFAPEAMKFSPDKINPIQGVKRLFTMKSVVTVIKGLMKFAIIMWVVYLFMKDKINSYGGFLHMDFWHAFLYGKDMIIQLGYSILVGLVVVVLADFGWEKFSYRKKLMMTKQELKQESKEKDGNPEIKQKIKQIQREMAQKRMLADVPGADVIVTNPTHISIALKYDENMIAPQVMAKGADHLAMKIREIAKENGVPLVENVPLARTLYKTVKVGEGVPRNLYKAIAEVLAFVYKLKQKNKALQ